VTVQKSTSGLNFEVMHRAFEQRDVELLMNLYADDAEVRIVNRDNPPSSPFELHGKEEIGNYLREAPPEITHRLDQTVADDEHAAATVVCQYPDGKRVLCAAMFDLREGKIVREVSVEAWDE
jgi:ketosteroid isomerase-like protein